MPLPDSLREMLSEEKSPENVEILEVVSWQGSFWAITGHRRLFLYKILQELGIVKTIPVYLKDLNDPSVKRKFDMRLTTTTDGLSMEIRQSQVKAEIETLIADWKSNNPGREDVKGKENVDLVPIKTGLDLSENKTHTEVGLLLHTKKFGFVILDRHFAIFATLCGNEREILRSISVRMPSKSGHVGSTAYSEALEKYVKNVSKVASQLYISDNLSNVVGIVIGGSAEFQLRLSQSDILDVRLQVKVIKIVKVCQGGKDGLNEAISLATEELENVKLGLQTTVLAKLTTEMTDGTGKFCIGEEDTVKALELGAVETLVVWERLDSVRHVLKNNSTNEQKVIFLKPGQESDESRFTDGETGVLLELIESQPLVQWFAKHYKDFGISLEVITDNSEDGKQFVKGCEGIGAILKYRVGSQETDELDAFGQGYYDGDDGDDDGDDDDDIEY